MVTLRIIVEGGSYDVNVASNVESLRQSLYIFFTKVLQQEDINIIIDPSAGYRNAAKKFIQAIEPISLFVDSDLPPEKKDKWFNTLINEITPEKSIVIPEDKIPYVFFMIQEMEAWFLKQIDDCLNEWAKVEGYTRKKPNLKLSNHSVIRNKNIETISKPSEKLALIMKVFFQKDGKFAIYGKLKTAPLLLDALNVENLVSQDSELQRFVSTVKSNH